MSAPDLALAGTDPAGFVLAVADLRERGANATTPGPWPVVGREEEGKWRGLAAGPFSSRTHVIAEKTADAEHIAAEANPAVALAEVKLWRGIVERHGKAGHKPCSVGHWMPGQPGFRAWIGEPCPDLLAVAAAAKAYLAGAA